MTEVGETVARVEILIKEASTFQKFCMVSSVPLCEISVFDSSGVEDLGLVGCDFSCCRFNRNYSFDDPASHPRRPEFSITLLAEM
jgi:hypothetical protein